MDLEDVIDEKDSSTLHLNLGFGASGKYAKIIAPGFLNNPDNDLVTVYADYAKDAGSDFLTVSDLADLDSTPENSRDFGTIREISGKRYPVSDEKRQTGHTGITLRAFTRNEPVSVKIRVNQWSTILYAMTACVNHNCIRGTSNYHGCSQQGSPCCGPDSCGSYDWDDKDYTDLPPNTTVTLKSNGSLFIMAWRFPVPGEYRVSIWGPIPNLQQLPQKFNPACGKKDSDACWDEVKDPKGFNFASAYDYMPRKSR